MVPSSFADFDVQVANSLAAIDADAWDYLSGDRVFQSYRWYRFGERIMSDSIPCYIFVVWQGKMIARATFWVVRNEPIPIDWAPARHAAVAIFRRWPLFICRSPVANTPGLILPPAPLRGPALAALVGAATREAKKYGASFLLFDFLTKEQASSQDWPKPFSSYSFSDPGTRMEIEWSSFDQYLASLSPKARKHYRQRNREAERLGIKISRHDSVENVEEALPLIEDVERRHHSTPNPWTRPMLENLHLVGGAWLTARLDGRIVGCELILEDNRVLMVTSLGLASRTSHVYHLLGYADIRYAIEKGAHMLRWGSGSYDTKRRLGFRLEDNQQVVFSGLSPFSRLAARVVSS
jgi:predicted N-acyltransferase